MSPTNYYVGGQFGELWHHNAGVWTRIDDLPATDINALACAAANDIFVALNGGLLYRFDGAQWTPVRTPLSEHLLSLSIAAGTNATSLYVGATTPSPTIVRLDRMRPWPASP